jgi:hypothetical protein
MDSPPADLSIFIYMFDHFLSVVQQLRPIAEK